MTRNRWVNLLALILSERKISMPNIELLERILLAEISKAEAERAEALENVTTLVSRIGICQHQIEQNTALAESKQIEIQELNQLMSELLTP